MIRSLADRTELCRSLDSNRVHDAAAHVASRLASPRQPSGSCTVAASERETLPAPLLSLRPKYRLPGENIAPTRTGQVTLSRGLGHTLTHEFPLRRRFLVGERERTDPCEGVGCGQRAPGRSQWYAEPASQSCVLQVVPGERLLFTSPPRSQTRGGNHSTGR